MGGGIPDARPEESRRRRRRDDTSSDEEEHVPAQGLSLTVVMKENPNLSVQEALAKLQIMKQMSGIHANAGGGPGLLNPAAAPGMNAAPRAATDGAFKMQFLCAPAGIFRASCRHFGEVWFPAAGRCLQDARLGEAWSGRLFQSIL